MTTGNKAVVETLQTTHTILSLFQRGMLWLFARAGGAVDQMDTIVNRGIQIVITGTVIALLAVVTLHAYVVDRELAALALLAFGLTAYQLLDNLFDDNGVFAVAATIGVFTMLPVIVTGIGMGLEMSVIWWLVFANVIGIPLGALIAIIIARAINNSLIYGFTPDESDAKPFLTLEERAVESAINRVLYGAARRLKTMLRIEDTTRGIGKAYVIMMVACFGFITAGTVAATVPMLLFAAFSVLMMLIVFDVFGRMEQTRDISKRPTSFQQLIATYGKLNPDESEMLKQIRWSGAALLLSLCAAPLALLLAALSATESHPTPDTTLYTIGPIAGLVPVALICAFGFGLNAIVLRRRLWASVQRRNYVDPHMEPADL